MAGTFKTITPADIKPRRSSLNQLVDIIQEDVSGSATRRKYQVFVTGGVGPGVTSSLFQTVYDQDFSLQTANPIFDMTVGLFSGSAGSELWRGTNTVVEGSGADSPTVSEDITGKVHFKSQSMMMREKIYNYQQFAQNLLGNKRAPFTSPFSSMNSQNATLLAPYNAATNVGDMIDCALFISFKRLFARDRIRPETFAMRFYQTASKPHTPAAALGSFQPYNQGADDTGGTQGRTNLNLTSATGSVIITDIGASTNMQRTHGGDVANLVDAADISRKVGLIFYDHGTIVLDLRKITSGSQFVSGSVDAMNDVSPDGILPIGTMIVGAQNPAVATNANAKFIPDFMVSGSIDNIIDHIASSRMQSGSLTSMTFQNVTNINSTLYFCRAGADDFNYSSNPTYKDSTGRVVVIDPGMDTTQRAFAFPTTVGLHDALGNLLAVAKLSRPIEKNDEKDITFRIRLDY